MSRTDLPVQVQQKETLDDIAAASERQAVALEQIHYILQQLTDILKERLGY